MTVVSVETSPSPEENANTGIANAPASDSPGSSQPYSMTEQMLENRRFTIERGKWITQLYALAIACISSISQGTVLGWSAPAVNTLNEETTGPLNLKNFALTSSLAPLGCSFGVVVWTYCKISVGPRKTMLFQAPFLFITWIALSLVQTAELAYAGRFFSGFFSISYMICGEALLQDCVNKNNLRYMMMAFRSCVFVGVLLSYIIGFLWADKLHFTCLSAVVVGIHFVLLIFVPESPVFLYEKHPKQAEKALIWYRGKRNLVLEMRDIKRDNEIKNLESSSGYILMAKVVIKGILIVVGMAIFQIMSGYYLIMFYNLVICKDSSNKLTTNKMTVISKFVDGLIIGITFLVSKVIAIQVHYSVPYGVKKPILLSGLCLGICLVLIGVYNTTQQFYPNIIGQPHWFNLIGAIGIIISYELGFGEYPAMMLFHYMPYQVYYRARSIMNFIHWFLCFLFIQFFIDLQEAITYSNVLIIVLGLCCFLSIYYANTFIVDFKDQTLIQIQLQLGGNPIGSRGGTSRREYSDEM